MNVQNLSASIRSTTGWLELACDRLAQVGLALIVLNVAASLGLGIVAILAWPELRVLGSGPGGGNGIPAIAFLVAIALGVPSFLLAVAHAALGRFAKWGRVIPFVGPAVVFFAFFFVSHAFDPCGLGLADTSTRLLGTPMCQYWGGGLEIHTRFHFLHHAVIPTVFFAYAYWLGLRSWHPAGERFDFPAGFPARWRGAGRSRRAR